jgi:hypothetical protein
LIRHSAAPAFLALVCLTDCAWVTNLGSDGYRLEEGGALSGCASAADCDGGGICCVTSLSPMATSCQPSCMSLPLVGGVQVCMSNGECAGGTCVAQDCSGNPMNANPINACGTLAACTPTDASVSPDTSVPTGISTLDASTIDLE